MLKKIIHSYRVYFVFLLSGIAITVHAEILEIDLAYVGDENHPAYLGAKQGLDEANLQGQFLGQKYTLATIAPQDSLNIDYANYLAVVTAVDRDTFLKISDRLPGMPVFNLTIEDDDLRTMCLPNALHIIPSQRMRADAVAQWKKKNTDSQAQAQAWHPDFEKYAGRDLNKRFVKAFQTKMDDHAWAGWAAVKMTSDTVARENITEPEKLLTYLKTNLLFDGQKGIEMNFRPTGELRQPLILVEGGKIVGEAPVRGVAESVDSMGISDCAK